jgi:hypothetical protein
MICVQESINTMPSEVLRFESAILHYGIASDEEPYSGQVGQLTVRELYSPPTDPELPPEVYNYQVIIEATVATREEGWKAKFEAHKLADDLDRAWVYVCGLPLHPVYTQLQFDTPPEGWRTNAKEVDVGLAQAEGKMYAIIGSEKHWHWMQLPFFPLREVLKVREGLTVASEAIRALADLHYGALKSLDSNGKLFLLAKGLELGSRLLPGKNNKVREKSLPENIRSALSHSLDWLFNTSNNRFDVRHVVKDPQGPQLHQRMTTEERSTFTKDADLVIRSIMCQGIGRPAFVVKHQ